MLVGREEERGRIEAMLDAARQGSSATLLIRGEPGIGKTALLEHAVVAAAGMLILRARGVESESELPFAGLGELLAPVLELRSRLPESQAEAIAGGLGLGPPAAVDRFRISAATLGILAAAGEATPVLAVVDDAHWLDRASAEALAFAARRLRSEGIVMLFADRAGTAGPLDQAGLPELVLEGLDERAAGELVSRVAGRVVASEVARGLHSASGGNPLALIEMVGAVDPAGIDGEGDLLQQLPTVTLEQRFLTRIADLPPSSRKALAVAAASGSEDMRLIGAALESAGSGVEALETAEEAGLVSLGADRLSFRHPLARSAAYHAATPAERRAAHQALAHAFEKQQDDATAAWHLAAAVVGPDESVASALAEAGQAAMARAAYSSAARAFERAASLTPEPELRPGRLLLAGQARFLAGELEEAMRLLEAARSESADPLRRAEILELDGRIRMWVDPSAARAVALEAAELTEGKDRERATMALVTAAMTCVQEGRLEEAVRHSERAVDLAQTVQGPATVAAYMAHATALGCRGDLDRSRQIALATHALLRGLPPPEGQGELASFGLVLNWLEEYEKAAEFLDGFILHGRELGAPSSVPYALAAKSRVEFRTGAWDQAFANATEAVQLSSQTRQEASLAHSLVCLAESEAGRGMEAECRDHVKQAMELERRLGAASLRTLGAHALGLLELGLGRPAESVAHLERCAGLARAHGLGNPNVVPWAADLFEAYHREGRSGEAQAVLTELEEAAVRTGSIAASSAVARCRGLSAGGEEFGHHFEEALRLLASVPTPFERARTELCFGERLRREGRRSEARPRLRTALGLFRQLEARPWTQIAERELRATGAVVRRRSDPSTSRLTPQEFQVAATVARGATNREAAAELFLSPRTIEFHLANVYRRLGVRSRSELAALFARNAPADS